MRVAVHDRVRRGVDELRDGAVVLVDETARLDRDVGSLGDSACRHLQQRPGEQRRAVVRRGVQPAGHAIPERRVQPGEQPEDQACLFGVERMQGVGELARVDREILQYQHVPARQGIKRRPV